MFYILVRLVTNVTVTFNTMMLFVDEAVLCFIVGVFTVFVVVMAHWLTVASDGVYNQTRGAQAISNKHNWQNDKTGYNYWLGEVYCVWYSYILFVGKGRKVFEKKTKKVKKTHKKKHTQAPLYKLVLERTNKTKDEILRPRRPIINKPKNKNLQMCFTK